MSWHYQAVKGEYRTPSGSVHEWYALHEVYDTGQYTEQPVSFVGNSIDELTWALETALADVRKYPVFVPEETTEGE